MPLPSKKDRQEIQARLEAARATLGAARPGAARRRRVAALGQPPGAGRAVPRDGGAQGGGEPRDAEPPHARAAGRAGSRWRWRRARRARRCGAASRRRRTRCSRARRPTWRRRTRSAHGNLARKQALSERAEALADSTDWVKTATEIQKLQAEWKTIGPVTRGHEKAVWERFRAACDRFFTRRQEDLKQRKDDWSANLTRKEALCEQAEALADSTRVGRRRGAAQAAPGRVEDDRAGAQVEVRGGVAAVPHRVRSLLRSLQASRSGRPAGQGGAARSDHPRARGAAAGAAGADAPAAPENLVATIHDARARWQQAPELPRAIQQDLAARYHQALGRLVATWPAAFAGTDLDPETHAQADGEAAGARRGARPAQPKAQAPLSPAELLAQQWRERLAANTMAGGRSAVGERGRALARRRAGSAQRAGAVDAARSRAARGRRAAQRAVPARLPPLLRPAPPRVVADRGLHAARFLARRSVGEGAAARFVFSQRTASRGGIDMSAG